MKKTIKIIDLLVKIANGEEVPKKIRIDHWCYKFEWVEHLANYYDEEAGLDLMEVLSMSEEELNYGVEIIEEDKKIEELKINDGKLNGTRENGNNYCYTLSAPQTVMVLKIIELTKAINELKGKSE